MEAPEVEEDQGGGLIHLCLVFRFWAGFPCLAQAWGPGAPESADGSAARALRRACDGHCKRRPGWSENFLGVARTQKLEFTVETRAV